MEAKTIARTFESITAAERQREFVRYRELILQFESLTQEEQQELYEFSRKVGKDPQQVQRDALALEEAEVIKARMKDGVLARAKHGKAYERLLESNEVRQAAFRKANDAHAVAIREEQEAAARAQQHDDDKSRLNELHDKFPDLINL